MARLLLLLLIIIIIIKNVKIKVVEARKFQGHGTDRIKTLLYNWDMVYDCCNIIIIEYMILLHFMPTIAVGFGFQWSF